VILPVFWYPCETRSLALRDEHISKIYDNREVRIFGSKEAEVPVTAEWKKLHDKELDNFYSSLILSSSGYQIKEVMYGTCVLIRRDEKCTQNLVRTPQGNSTLRKPRHKLDDNIKMDPK
jgi:hypothetical protein